MSKDGTRELLEAGGKELIRETLQRGFDYVLLALERGDLDVIYDQATYRDLDEIEAALLRQRLVSQAFSEADARSAARSEAFSEALSDIGSAAARIALGVAMAAL